MGCQIVEAYMCIMELQLNGSGWPVALLGYNDLGDSLFFAVRIVVFITVYKKN